jgi:uncharacterized membrane protein
MQPLVTRFHLLLLIVTVSIAIVGFLRIPPDVAIPATWSMHGDAWLWPRNGALAVAPLVQAALLVTFLVLGRTLPRAAIAYGGHVLDPALTLGMTVVLGTQMGILLIGVGSDIDFVRLTALALGILLLPLGVVFFEARRHTYAGLRMPWPLRSDRTWTWVHRTTGAAMLAAGVLLLVTVWFNPGIAWLILAMSAALVVPAMLGALLTLLLQGRA